MTGPVLIIEDEPDIAEVLRHSLEKAGFNTRRVRCVIFFWDPLTRFRGIAT
jgi:DNA-binding response OmpR family regulator